MSAFSSWLAFRDNMAEMYARTQQETKPYLSLPTIAPNYPIRKCPSCGSRQFVMHANRRICSYCRSEG